MKTFNIVKKYFSTKFKLSEPWKSQILKEGVGGIMYRIISTENVPNVDPLILLDFLKNSRLPGGFADHPHRGFETVTYVIDGKIHHEDFNGYKGILEEGDVQCLTAGRGIMHSNLPYSFDNPTSALQLWVNLKKENKMSGPRYQEVKNGNFPIIKGDNYSIKVIQGKIGEVIGPSKSITHISYFDINMEANAEAEIPINQGNSGIAFLFEGDNLKVNDTILNSMHAIRFDTNSENINLKFKSGDTKSRFVLIFGEPLNESIVKQGPFVMNTQEEIDQAVEDFQMAKNGFEKSLNWKSKTRELVNKL